MSVPGDLEEEGLLVYLIEADQEIRRDLTRQITYYGYRVLSFERMENAREAAELVYPAVIIAGITGQEIDTLMSAADIVFMREQAPPIVYLSDRDDPEIRLTAVRSGAKAFYKRPVDPNRLAALLNDLTARRDQQSHRVLIVEEDARVRSDTAALLRGAGIETRELDDPRQVPEVLEEYQPELILLSLYYRDVLGTELAALIRQFDAAAASSIVFLSRETERDLKLAAMRTSADIVLSHPIEPEIMLAVVKARVERSRTLRSLMVRDNLTGLFNHTSLVNSLANWSARVRREADFRFSYGIVDIDKFKRVNDTYGHATGDRVIQSLARTLRHHVSVHDVVGRYGGEEFAVLFRGMDGDQAAATMRQIHDDFARIRHLSEQGEFYTTFSSGVAFAGDFADPADLHEAADRSLYQAKHAGGNRVGRCTGTDGTELGVDIIPGEDGLPSGPRTDALHAE